MREMMNHDKSQRALAMALVAGVFDGNADCTSIVREFLDR